MVCAVVVRGGEGIVGWELGGLFEKNLSRCFYPWVWGSTLLLTRLIAMGGATPAQTMKI